LKPTREAKKGRPVAIRGDRTIPAPAPVSHAAILVENDALDGFEMRFPTKPSDACLARLRATHDLPTEQRWHWHFRKKFWYAKRNDVTRAFAASILAAPSAVAPAKAEAPEPVEPVADPFPVAHWAHAVQSGATSLAYPEWVEAMIAAADDAPEPSEDAHPASPVAAAILAKLPPATLEPVFAPADPNLRKWLAEVKAGITGLEFGDWTVQRMSEASGDSPAMVGRFINAAAGNAEGAAIIQIPQRKPEPVAEEQPSNILPVSFAPQPPVEAVPVVPSACRAVASAQRLVPAWRARFGRRP